MIPAYTTGEKYAAVKNGRCACSASSACPARHAPGSNGYGEAQRVTIARALINNPAVVIADEPTAHLTPSSKDFLGIMEQLNAEGKTILIASHDPLVYEAAMVHRMVEMRDGQIGDARRVP
jgi:putative ABC transport system ATP-binding protein